MKVIRSRAYPLLIPNSLIVVPHFERTIESECGVAGWYVVIGHPTHQSADKPPPNSNQALAVETGQHPARRYWPGQYQNRGTGWFSR
jgi:hypothetical protein